MSDDPFYVGYLDHAPPGNARAVKIVVPILALLLVLALALLVRAQEFDESRFEFGQTTEVNGTYRSAPYPHLQGGDGSITLLVGTGKHRVQLTTQGDPVLPGTPVAVAGTRIIRDGVTMLEVPPTDLGELPEAQAQPMPLQGRRTELTGEVVGSKCYLGVMNPGRGPVHRACASHCILGGVPALLHGDGEPRLLTGLPPKDLAAAAARPARVYGHEWSLPGIQWVVVDSLRFLE